MGYIAPSTTITFYRDTGLSPNYDNTLYFTTEADKNSYFNTWSSTNNRIVAVANNSYQRANRNYVRVNINISLLYDCDYMRFVNANYENKIFYAFVMNVNYINNNTTEVEYQIDYLMTWMGNFYCRPCWIERQTPATDVIGANKIGEPIGVNGYVEEGTEYSDDWGQSNSTIRIQYADPDEAQANKWGGIYNPTKFIDSDDASTIANTIEDLVQQDLVDNIVNIYMVPKDFENPGSVNEKSVSVTKPVFTIDGYTPKNKKLLLFPYKYLLVDNSEGNQKTFYYEYFSDDKCNFTIYGTSVNNVEIDLIPNNYLGHVGMDFTNKLVMSHFPVCAWSYDIYEAYVAQKNAYLLHDTVKAGVNGFINGLTGAYNSGADVAGSRAPQPVEYSGIPSTELALPGPVGPTPMTGAITPGMVAGAIGLASGVADASRVIANNTVDNLIRPEAGSTTVGSGNSDVAFQTGQKRFTFHKMCINAQQAKMVDDYFSMFGYAQKKIAIPNMNARPHWTYVKTVACMVEGRIPAKDKATIESIFDHGIRFWKSLDEMGNYALDNSPTS